MLSVVMKEIMRYPARIVQLYTSGIFLIQPREIICRILIYMYTNRKTPAYRLVYTLDSDTIRAVSDTDTLFERCSLWRPVGNDCHICFVTYDCPKLGIWV